MNRNAVVGMLLREVAEEMPIVLRALPDDRLWSVMVAGLMADDDTDALAEKIAGMPVTLAGAADWREFYGALREMVNETALVT
jgi:hypothetical protein